MLGSTAISSSTLDKQADEFGMSSNRLLRTLQRATSVGDRESLQKIEERLMEHYGIDPKTREEYPEAADINTATKEELQTMQGIGPKLSALIVANQPYLHSPFQELLRSANHLAGTRGKARHTK